MVDLESGYASKNPVFSYGSAIFLVYQLKNYFARGIAEDSKCEACGREAETILHVLRDCEIAKKFWLDTGNMRCSSNFFNSDLCSWLKKNLRRCNDLVESTLPWEVFFAFGIWGLWMQKNKRVFNQVIPNSRLSKEVKSMALNYFYYAGHVKPMTTKSPISV